MAGIRERDGRRGASAAPGRSGGGGHRAARAPRFRDRPASSRAKVLLWSGVAAIVATALLTPVHDATSPAGHEAIVIPPAPVITFARATVSPSASPSHTAKAKAKATPQATPAHPHIVSAPPIAGGSYAGSVLLNATGSQLTAWNQTSTYCTEQSWEVPNGTVSTDHSNDAVLAVNGQDGSCVGLISPQAYSSVVIEAYIYFPPLPGKPDTIADWTSFWLTDQATWPADGELDAVEAEPVTGVNATAWHWGSVGNELSMSTDGFAANGTLPKDGPNLTPGWHVVDVVYTKGFFAVYYDGKEFTSLTSDVVTGSPLNLLITTSVTPNIGQVQQTIGGPPVNSDSSPAGMAVKYVKIWSFR